MDISLNVSATQFSLTNARTLAVVSGMAYSERPTIQSELAHVLILRTPQAVIVAARGTANPRDAMTDIEISYAQSDVGRIHSGFKRSVDSIWPAVESAIGVPGNPVFFCGHSLGGSQAVEMARRWGQRSSVYTYGQPRVGDGVYARECDRVLPRHYRMVLAEDIVPRSASAVVGFIRRFPWLQMGYRHSGEMVFLPSAGGVMEKPPLTWILFSDVYGGLRGLNRFTLTALADHHVQKYVDRLNSFGQ